MSTTATTSTQIAKAFKIWAESDDNNNQAHIEIDTIMNMCQFLPLLIPNLHRKFQIHEKDRNGQILDLMLLEPMS